MNLWSLVRILYPWATCDKHPAYRLGLEFTKGEWRIFKPGKNVRIIFYRSAMELFPIFQSSILEHYSAEEKGMFVFPKRTKNNFLSSFWQCYIIDYRWLEKSVKKLAENSKTLWNSPLLALTNVSH